jgi:hypothetical protein
LNGTNPNGPSIQLASCTCFFAQLTDGTDATARSSQDVVEKNCFGGTFWIVQIQLPKKTSWISTSWAGFTAWSIYALKTTGCFCFGLLKRADTWFSRCGEKCLSK